MTAWNDDPSQEQIRQKCEAFWERCLENLKRYVETPRDQGAETLQKPRLLVHRTRQERRRQ